MTINNFDDALKIIKETMNNKKRLIIAIDGRCASGKTTFSEFIKQNIPCNVFHVDDFFLRPCQRTAERLSAPGGNFDIERFNSEIISGILSEQDFTFSPFNCKTMSLSAPVKVTKSNINIVEGSYSCHPENKIKYDLTFFVTTSAEKQRERIIKRNKEKAEMFFNKWIPLEEQYFSTFDIENKSDHIILT